MDIFISQMLLVALLILLLYIGEAISIRTKAFIPSVFVTAVLFLIGYWIGMPKDIIAKAGFSGTTIMMFIGLLIVNMGTLLSVDQLKQQWRVILITLGSIVGVLVFLLIIGTLLLDWNTVVTATPPLVGGIVSSIIMSQAATEIGRPDLAVLAILIFVLQGFAGYPLTAMVLKKEGGNILAKYRAGKLAKVDGVDTNLTDSEDNNSDGGLKFISKKYNTPYFKYLSVAIFSALAFAASALFKKIGLDVHAFVMCLIMGIIGKSLGLLEVNPLKRAGGFSFVLMGLMVYIFDGLNRATFDMVASLIIPVIVIIGIGVIGMYIFSMIIGRILGISKELSFAVSLTALYGFPADYVITTEVVNSLTEDEDEREVLSSHLLPPMLVAGFITVTIVSVVLAGIMVNYLVA